MATKKYIVKNTTLMHNGTTYASGSIVSLDEKTATKLEDILIPVAEEPKKPENKNQKKSETQPQPQTQTEPSTENKTAKGTEDNTTPDNNNGGNE